MNQINQCDWIFESCHIPIEVNITSFLYKVTYTPVFTGVAFVIILALQVLFGVLADLWHIPTNENQKLVMDELRKTYYLAAVIDIMMAPIMEEIIFRFKFFEYFDEFMSKWVGIIVNGILFMVIHSTDLNVVTLVYFVIGAVLAYVYRRRNDLGDSIAVHMLNNAYAILL